MKRYNVSKYENRQYTCGEEWTSWCDIGAIYHGKIFTLEEYRKMEDAYVVAVLEILRYMNIQKVRIKNIHRHHYLNDGNPIQRKLFSDSIRNVYEIIENNHEINLELLDAVIRLQLREDLECMVYVPYRFKLFIGYDYEMGVHASMNLEKLYPYIFELGLNIYEF